MHNATELDKILKLLESISAAFAHNPADKIEHIQPEVKAPVAENRFPALRAKLAKLETPVAEPEVVNES